MGDQFTLADPASVGEELFLEVFGDPALDDDVVAIALDGKSYLVRNENSRYFLFFGDAYLVPVPGQVVGKKGFGEQVLAVDLNQS